MNTLNYKVLLIKTGFLIFLRAIGIYLLLTLPTLGVPAMYLLSAGYALSFGWIAGLLFLLAFCLLQKINIAFITKQILLYVFVPVAVLVAFQMMDVLGAWDNVWASGGFLLFPAAAVVSGWISLATSGQKIKSAFFPLTVDYYESVIINAPTAKTTSNKFL